MGEIDVRRGRVFRRCTECGSTAEAKRCPKCGSDRASWAFQVDLNPRGEPRRQAKRSGFPTKAAAVAAMGEIQTQAASGRPEPSRLTVAEWLDEWLASIQGKVRGGTLANYATTVRRHIGPRIGSVPLRTLTTARVEGMYADLAAGGSSRGGGLAPKSVHNVHQVLHRSLAAAVRNDLIARNQADGAHSLPSGRQEMKTWTADQVGVFLAQAKDDRLYALWRLAVMTGMRRGELLGLRWTDVDFDGRFVSIQQQRVRQGVSGVVHGPPKTVRGRRRVPIDPTTTQALREHRRAQVVEGIDGLAFTHIDGPGLDPDVVSGMFDRIAREAGLPRIRLHDLRHTAATLMLRAGVHPKVVQERLGHASIAMTLDLYSHAVPAMAAEAADALAALVDAT